MNMGDSTTFGAVPDGATIIAESGGHQYLAVAWVYRRQPGGQLDYYATVAAWAQTPAAQLAARDEEIAALHARIAELEARLRSEAPPTAPPADEPPAPLEVCGIDGCTAEKPSGASMRMHRQRVHRQRPPDTATDEPEPAPPVPAPPPRVVDTPAGWRCAECLSDAHAQSLRDPALCIRCAAVPASSNGVHA